MGVSKPRQEVFYSIIATFDHERKHAPITIHLLSGNIMLRMRLYSWIKNFHHLRMFIQMFSYLHGVLALSIYTQVKGFHPSQQKIGGHWLQNRPVYFSKMIDLLDQLRGPANDPA